MKIANWIKPKTAPRDDLLAQLEAAKTTRATAWAEVTTAQTAFDADGSVASEKALLAARSAAESSDLHLGRAQRLLEAHDQAEVDAKRHAAEARIAEITQRLSKPAVDALLEPLAKREVEALLHVADVLTHKAVQLNELKDLVWERFRLRQQIGEDAPHPMFSHGHTVDLNTRKLVVDALLREARKLADRDPRRNVLNGLIEQHGGDALPEPKFVDESVAGAV